MGQGLLGLPLGNCVSWVTSNQALKVVGNHLRFRIAARCFTPSS